MGHYYEVYLTDTAQTPKKLFGHTFIKSYSWEDALKEGFRWLAQSFPEGGFAPYPLKMEIHLEGEEDNDEWVFEVVGKRVR